MIFVDTSAWFASFVPSDTDYTTAIPWLMGQTVYRNLILTAPYVFFPFLILFHFPEMSYTILYFQDFPWIEI